MGDAYRWVTEALRAPYPNESRGELDLKRALKWKFLLPIILLHNPPSGSGTRARLLQPIVSHRMTMYNAGDFSGLIVNLERDILIMRSVHHSDNRTLEGRSSSPDFSVQRLRSFFSQIGWAITTTQPSLSK